MEQQKNKNFRGFTLIEALVCMLLISVLIALAWPSLSAARMISRELRCVQSTRETMRFVHLYSGDYKDYFPTWIGDSQNVTFNPPKWRRYVAQGYTLMHKQPWMAYTGLNRASPLFHCPENALMRADPSGETVNFDYALCDAMYIDPNYLNPDLDPSAWMGKLGGRVQQLTSVTWPSAKVGEFEKDVWHGWRGSFVPGANLVGLEYYASTRPGSVAYFDGHAELSRPRAQPWINRVPIWNYSPYGMTAFGIRGRDK